MSVSKFHIFHTNDLHSHFEQWPKVVSLLNEKRKFHSEQGCDVLTFDIGDHADRVHPLTESTLGKANVLLMNDVHYNSVTIGNNEGITISKSALSDLYENANFPVLVANLFHQNGGRPNWLKPYHIIPLQHGLKAGVIGMTIPFRPFYEALGWRIEDPFKLLPAIVEEVQQQADIVILLSHLGLNFDEEVANNVEGIDIILGGHTHNVLEKGLYINNTIIHQAGKFGQYVGELSITYDHNKREIVDYKAACLSTINVAICEKTVLQIECLTEKQDFILSDKVSTIDEPLDVSWIEPSPLPQLLASALKQWCKAEIGMVNSGVILDQLTKGSITKGDIHRICPHPINPCKVRLTGKILKETIQYGVSDEMVYKKFRGFGFRGKQIGIMVFEGISYETTKLTDGLNHAKNIFINGEPIDPERIYEVATVDMFTFGHLYPSIAAVEDKKYFMPELLRDLLAWKLQS